MKKTRLRLFLLRDIMMPEEYVASMLQQVCAHNVYQAEQCVMIANTVGRAQIDHGNMSKISNVYSILAAQGLNVEIE